VFSKYFRVSNVGIMQPYDLLQHLIIKYVYMYVAM
jgi:hypothetical protein